MSFLSFSFLSLLLASTAAAAAKNDVCPPVGQTPNLAGLAGQFVFLRQGEGACPAADAYDSIKVSAACRQAQADLYKSNPALQTAMENYVLNVQQPLAQVFFEKNQDANFNAAQVPGHAEFKAQCQKATGAMVHHVEQNLSCGTRDYHFQLRNDLACVAEVCSEAERNVDNLAVMKLLVSESEDSKKISGSSSSKGTCGGGFADYTGYTWYMYLPMLLWLVATGGCLLLAQKQKNLYGYK